MDEQYESFYARQYKGNYASRIEKEESPFYETLITWMKRNPGCLEKSFLEIGSGRGALQDAVHNYVGIDFVKELSCYYHKPFFCGSAEEMPFDADSFDVIWSYAVWEHIPNPERAFNEVIRVLKNGGVFLLEPAWHCRPWFANGYQVRPYADFNVMGKMYKFIIPLLEWLPLRATKMMFMRMIVLFKYLREKEDIPFYYHRLMANYKIFWQSDSDACNDLDPFFVILWFKSRGCDCINYPTLFKQFFCRTGLLEFRINKQVKL